MTRSLKRIALSLARALVLAILLLGALTIAYFCLRLLLIVGGAIASAWRVELCIPLLMLVAGICMCGLAGHLLADDSRTKVQQSRKPNQD